MQKENQNQLLQEFGGGTQNGVLAGRHTNLKWHSEKTSQY